MLWWFVGFMEQLERFHFSSGVYWSLSVVPCNTFWMCFCRCMQNKINDTLEIVMWYIEGLVILEKLDARVHSKLLLIPPLSCFFFHLFVIKVDRYVWWNDYMINYIPGHQRVDFLTSLMMYLLVPCQVATWTWQEGPRKFLTVDIPRK